MRPSFQISIPESARQVVPIDSGYLVPRWSWLDWVLRKLGLLKKAYYQSHQMTWKTTTIKANCIRELLYRYRDDVFREYNETITDVYVGRDYFKRFLDAVGSDSVEQYTFRANVLLSLVQGHAPCSARIWGVRVHFIPWFEGFLPVPDPEKHLIQERH